MVQRARYFDTVNYTEAEFAEVQNRLLPEGVLRGVGSELVATAPGGMIVRIGTGEGMIQGFWYKNDAVVDVPIPANNSGSTRNDNIVLRLTRTADIVSLVHIPGAPAPTRAVGGMWEMVLVTVAVPNGAGAIVPANLTDQRQSADCGYTGGGDAPDGSVTSPGMAFTGNRATGFWRNTAGLADGGVRLSINAGAWYYWDKTGFTFGVGGPAGGGGAVFQTYAHPGLWMQTVPNSGYGGILFGNHVDYAQQTKKVMLGYATAASQYLGGDGDLSMYTDGSASGILIFGTAATRKMTIGKPQVSIGGFTGPAALNVFTSTQGPNGGIKLYHINNQHHVDIQQASDASVWMTNVDHTGLRALTSLILHVSSGYVSVGGSMNGYSRFGVVQQSQGADQGIALQWGGGYMRQYVVDEGSVMMQSATTGVRLWHSVNAFTCFTNNGTSLGTVSYQWSNLFSFLGTIGCTQINGATLDPIGSDGYHIGATNRWHTIRSLVMNANTSMNTPMLFLDQTNPNTSGGLRFHWAGTLCYQFQDSAGHFNLYGPGSAARAHLLLLNNQAVFRPAAEQGCDLGQNGGRWAALWCNAINANGVVSCLGLNTQGYTITSAGITCTTINTQNNGVNAGSGTGTFGAINASGTVVLNALDSSQASVRPPSPGSKQLGQNGHSWADLFCSQGWKPTGADWVNYSDDRHKYLDRFRPYTPGLTSILRMRPVHYVNNGEFYTTDGEEGVGLRTSELLEFAPDLVTTLKSRRNPESEEEDAYFLDTSNLRFMMVNAIQELHAKIEALEAALRDRMN